MCAVIGYSGAPGAAASDTLGRLFDESKIRGLHAFGIASYLAGAGEKIEVTRFLNREDARERLCALARDFPGDRLRMIAHCRYSTSGDWQTEANNQPIAIGGIALAFNGCIHMGTREEWGAAYGFTPETDNDGEIFLRKAIDGEDWEHWVRAGAFSFAGVMLMGGHVVALRNKQRPLYYLHMPHGHYIGSTADIFARAELDGAKFIPPGHAVTLP